MKFLFDLLPVILFFVAYKWAGGHADAAATLLADAGLPSVASSIAPILLATAVAIAATVLQVSWLLARRKRVDTMLWVSLGIIVVMGGLTLWLQDPVFIMWKPTLLYWAFALALGGSMLWRGRNLLRTLMGSQLELPEAIWTRLNFAWTLFFAGMGVLNLYVAFHFEESVWVAFKVYGGMGLTLLFVLAQALYLARHLPPDQLRP